jgi:hypothetical protein
MKTGYVVEATLSDIPGIIAVLEENMLIKKDKSDVSYIEKSGFLITRHTEKDLRAWIADKKNHIVLVYKEADEIKGYILGCDVKTMASEMQSKFAEVQSLKDILSANPVLYHKQIGVKPGYKGVGGELLQAFFAKAAALQYKHIICLIVHEPILNKISVGFHQKYGFVYKGLVSVEDMKDGVYLKSFI